MNHCIELCIKLMFCPSWDWWIPANMVTSLPKGQYFTLLSNVYKPKKQLHEFVCLFDEKRQSTDCAWDAPSVTESRKICFQEIRLGLKNNRILLLTRKQHKALDRRSQAIMFESYQNSSDLQTAVSSYSICFWTSATCQRSLHEWAGKKLLF